MANWDITATLLDQLSHQDITSEQTTQVFYGLAAEISEKPFLSPKVIEGVLSICSDIVPPEKMERSFKDISFLNKKSFEEILEWRNKHLPELYSTPNFQYLSNGKLKFYKVKLVRLSSQDPETQENIRKTIKNLSQKTLEQQKRINDLDGERSGLNKEFSKLKERVKLVNGSPEKIQKKTDELKGEIRRHQREIRLYNHTDNDLQHEKRDLEQKKLRFTSKIERLTNRFNELKSTIQKVENGQEFLKEINAQNKQLEAHLKLDQIPSFVKDGVYLIGDIIEGPQQHHHSNSPDNSRLMRIISFFESDSNCRKELSEIKNLLTEIQEAKIEDLSIILSSVKLAVISLSILVPLTTKISSEDPRTGQKVEQDPRIKEFIESYLNPKQEERFSQ